ncbi:MAG: shikimate kinase [Aquificaceae bacterium]
MKLERIFLVGFMCSGKSTVGSALSKALGWRYLDTDLEIEKKLGKSIDKIFKEEGEAFFREFEIKVLKEIINNQNIVISTGGGLGANIAAMEIMLGSGFVVWLRIDFETFISRCSNTHRPLLSIKEVNLKQLMQNREEVYKLAHLELDSSRDLDDVIKDLLHRLDRVCDINKL